MKCSDDFAISNPTNQAYLMATGACALAVTIWMVGMRLKQEPITLQAKLICAGVVIAPPAIRMAQIAIQHLAPDSLTPEQEESEKEFPGKRIDWDNINKRAPAVKKALPDTPGHPCFEELLTQLEGVTGLKEKTVAALTQHVQQLQSNPAKDKAAADFAKRFILLLRPREDLRAEAFRSIESYMAGATANMADAIQNAAQQLFVTHYLTTPALPAEPNTHDLLKAHLTYLCADLWKELCDHLYTGDDEECAKYIRGERNDLPTGAPYNLADLRNSFRAEKADIVSFFKGTTTVLDYTLPESMRTSAPSLRKQYQTLQRVTGECRAADGAGDAPAVAKAQTHYYLKHITAYLASGDVSLKTGQRTLSDLADKLDACVPSWTETARHVATELYCGKEPGEEALLRMAAEVRRMITLQFAQKPPDGQKDWASNQEGHWHRMSTARKMLGAEFGFDLKALDHDMFQSSRYGQVEFTKAELLKHVKTQYTVQRLVHGIATQLAMRSNEENRSVLELLQEVAKGDPFLDETLIEFDTQTHATTIKPKAIALLLEHIALIKDITV